MRRSPIALCASLLLIATTLSAAPPKDSTSDGVVSRIKRTPVDSTAMDSVGYSHRLRALEIEFRNGAIYRYIEVERSIYRELMASASKTRFYHEKIRGKYRSLHVRRSALERARASR
jgi:hypothetical protein